MKKPLKRIPINRAKEIAEKYGYEKVIILAVTEREDRIQFWLTTYGKDKGLCARAKRIGDFFIEVLNHPGLLKNPRDSVMQILSRFTKT